MKKDENNEMRIGDIFNSVNGLQRATPRPYLLTRINARLNNPIKNIWENMATFISRPSVVIAGICLFLLVNISVLVYKNSTSTIPAAERSYTTIADEYDDYNNLATIDNIENQQ